MVQLDNLFLLRSLHSMVHQRIKNGKNDSYHAVDCFVSYQPYREKSGA